MHVCTSYVINIFGCMYLRLFRSSLTHLIVFLPSLAAEPSNPKQCASPGTHEVEHWPVFHRRESHFQPRAVPRDWRGTLLEDWANLLNHGCKQQRP